MSSPLAPSSASWNASVAYEYTVVPRLLLGLVLALLEARLKPEPAPAALLASPNTVELEPNDAPWLSLRAAAPPLPSPPGPEVEAEIASLSFNPNPALPRASDALLSDLSLVPPLPLALPGPVPAGEPSVGIPIPEARRLGAGDSGAGREECNWDGRRERDVWECEGP